MTKRNAKSTRKPLFKGATKSRSDTMSIVEVAKAIADPRQEFWPGIPPAKHRSSGFAKDPKVRAFLKTGNRYAKYAFNPDGSRIYLYFGE